MRRIYLKTAIKKYILVYFLAVVTYIEQNSRIKLVISKAVRKFNKIIFLLSYLKNKCTAKRACIVYQLLPYKLTVNHLLPTNLLLV